MKLDLEALLHTQSWIDRPSVLMSLVADDESVAAQELQRFACWCARQLLPLLPPEPIQLEKMIALFEQDAEGKASVEDLLFAKESLRSTDRVLTVVQQLTSPQSPDRVIEAINIITDDLAWGFQQQARRSGSSDAEAAVIASAKIEALGFGSALLQAELVRRAVRLWTERWQ